MSRSHKPSTSLSRNFDRDGFEPLNRGDATIDIPLEQVPQPPSRPPAAGRYNSYEMAHQTEKTGLFRRRGLRHSIKPGQKHSLGRTGYDGEEDSVNGVGMLYKRFLKAPTITRYLFYVLPLGFLLAVPIVIGAIVNNNAEIGSVRIVWFFLWLECCWVGLWTSKIVAHFLPRVFQFLCGIVSAGTRKYASILKALEIPLSLVGWALVSLASFIPIMTRNPDAPPSIRNNRPEWMSVVNRILASSLIASLIFLSERFFIQIITINYHRKQFSARIKESKHSIHLLTLLYEASRTMFPAFCPEFADEDAVIGDTIEAAFRGHGHKKAQSGSSTPMRILRDVGRLGDKVQAAFGTVAHEVTGKPLSSPDSAHSIVIEALEKNRSSEALARRLWLSFVIEGQDALYQDDVIEVLGAGRETEAEECFTYLDRDTNGDVSLDEMIMTVTQFGRERQAIAGSMHDVDQAIKVLDRMLCVIVFIAVVFVFIAFLNTSFVTTLATTGTALLSLSFVFSVSAQEVLGSCIFLFVKHPFDLGDRIDLNQGADQMIVEHISLLFTVFRRVESQRCVQIPNIVLNTLWIENVTRSKAMTEQLSLFVSFDTSLEDIQLLRKEMQKFVMEKQNSRDFQPNLEVEVVGINEMDKLELRVAIAHKSNWANETVRAARRSKFMCALVLALRKVPIYGPGGGDPALGAAGNPTYSVAISDLEATKKKDGAEKEKEGKRMVPSAPPVQETDEIETQGLGPPKELNGMNLLNERSPALDGARDIGSERDPGLTPTSPSLRGSESQEIEEVRGMLRRETTKGRRKSGRTSENSASGTTGTTVVAIDGSGYGSESAGRAGASFNPDSMPVPRVGITTATPSSQRSGYGLSEEESQSSDDYWEAQMSEERYQGNTTAAEGGRMYSNFPPPPAPTMRPREGLPSIRTAGFQQHQPPPPAPSQQWRQ